MTSLWRTLLISALSALTVFVIFFSLTYSFFVFGPIYETHINPVVKGVQATPVEIDRENQVVRVALIGTKVRACKRTTQTALVLIDGVWQGASVYFTDPRVPGFNRDTQLPPSNRPLGEQAFSEAYITPIGDRVRVHVNHDCHPMWETKTFMYELDLTQEVGK